MNGLESALKALRKDLKMAALIQKHGPPNLAAYHGKISVFESLLRSIIYQQLSGYAAAAIHSRVLALMGGSPAPQKLLRLRAPALRRAGLSLAKIAYVRDLARKCLDGTIDEKRFPKCSSEEIVEHLVAVKGVGEWTAHMVLIFNLHRLDILPIGDLAIRKGFQKVYGLRKQPTAKQMVRLAAPWRAHASIASWYLWREMDLRRRTRVKAGGLKSKV